METIKNDNGIRSNSNGDETKAPQHNQDAQTSFVTTCQSAFSFISPLVSIGGFLLNAFYAGLGTTMGLLFFFAGELTLLTYLIAIICIGVHHSVQARS